MTVLDTIKEKIQHLYRTNPKIHITVILNRPKVNVTNCEATIIGVYPNIFQIESQGKHYTVQYTEVLMKSIIISELENNIN